ncbi:hypothetical protein D5086_017436 [Populus alba]|uniref:Uncharacterized protein n=1 Tax=Populus alba TaxID=43335 RepID=A0ACC4BY95_POPAL
MAKNKRKAKAFATRGKRTQLPSGLDDHNSYVLALRAPDSSLLASSSTSSSLHPPSVHTEGPASLSPIPEDVSCNLEIPLPDLEVVTVEDCSDDEPLADALLADEQLDLDFSDDDGGDMPSHVPSPSVSVPPSSSAACLPLSPKASQGYPSSSITVADATPISYSGTPSGLASPSSPRSRSFSPPRVTQGCLPPAIPYATPSPVTSPLEVQPIPAPSVEPAHPVQLNALSSSDTYTDWIAMEPRRKAKKHNRPNPKGKEVISDDMETYVAPSNCAGMTGPPRAKDPPTSTVVTRPSSTTRPTPTLLINPHDGPPNLVTVTDNRRAPPPHSRVS